MKTVYSDDKYVLGEDGGGPVLIANGKSYRLSCHPYEPCLYIKDAAGRLTVVHNAFDPDAVLASFADGELITSITGFEYDALDFCRMAEYAACYNDIGIDDAEKVFGGRPKKKAAAPPEKEEESRIYPNDPFYSVIREYPAVVVDYMIVKTGLPYSGCQSHRSALFYACRRLFFDKEDGEMMWSGSVDGAECRIIGKDELFAPCRDAVKLNYRRAFLHPPYETNYKNADFDRVNNALFPNGTDTLEVYEWTTDWSDYFDDGHEWWGTLCYTVYDKSLDRFVVIMASATD